MVEHEEISSVPWRGALGVSEAGMPGRMLRGGRYKEGLTQRQLAEKIGLTQWHISEMENNKRKIDEEIARRLGRVLHVEYSVFLLN